MHEPQAELWVGRKVAERRGGVRKGRAQRFSLSLNGPGSPLRMACGRRLMALRRNHRPKEEQPWFLPEKKRAS